MAERAREIEGAEARASAPERSGDVAGVIGRAEVASNYQYWREHGAGWAAEYDRRKQEQICYHIQEMMLTEYVRHHAPAKVLEFGCGPGRHLRNLSRLPGVEVFGFDQSAAMVSGCLTWTSSEWIQQRVTVGMPTGRLPFVDKQFDLVYTAEVLVHVRPEDLEATLRELMRVARRQVFHLETSPNYQIVSNEHDGCWWHDLASAYARLGVACETLTNGYEAHTPYRVRIDRDAATWEWSPIFLELCRRLERDVMRSLTNARQLQAQLGEAHAQLHAAQAEVDSIRGQLADARGRLDVEGQQRHVAQLAAEAERARAAAAEGRVIGLETWKETVVLALRAAEARAQEARAHAASLEKRLSEMQVDEAGLVRSIERQLGR